MKFCIGVNIAYIDNDNLQNVTKFQGHTQRSRGLSCVFDVRDTTVTRGQYTYPRARLDDLDQSAHVF